VRRNYPPLPPSQLNPSYRGSSALENDIEAKEDAAAHCENAKLNGNKAYEIFAEKALRELRPERAL
jgi:hypothetical protein